MEALLVKIVSNQMIGFSAYADILMSCINIEMID